MIYKIFNLYKCSTEEYKDSDTKKTFPNEINDLLSDINNKTEDFFKMLNKGLMQDVKNEIPRFECMDRCFEELFKLESKELTDLALDCDQMGILIIDGGSINNWEGGIDLYTVSTIMFQRLNFNNSLLVCHVTPEMGCNLCDTNSCKCPHFAEKIFPAKLKELDCLKVQFVVNNKYRKVLIPTLITQMVIHNLSKNEVLNNILDN